MEVVFFAGIKEYTDGITSVEIEPDCCPDLRSMISELGIRFGRELEAVLLGGERLLMLVNGKAVMSTGGLDTPLKQGDIIEILPVAGAG